MSLLAQAISLFHKYVRNKFVRFLLVGGLNTLFGMGVYCLMIWIGASYIWATLVSQILGILFNFVTTGTLVFENNNPRLIVRFVICYVVTYFINIGINKAVQVSTGCDAYISGIVAIILTALCSFFILKYFVYGREKEN